MSLHTTGKALACQAECAWSPVLTSGQRLCSALCVQYFRCNQLVLRCSQSVFGCRELEPYLGATSSKRPQVMFLDLAWGGSEGQVTYPPFVNGKAVRTVKNPDGQLILKNHDTRQLKETLRRCRQQQYRQPSTSLRRCPSVHACRRHVRCIAPPMAASIQAVS